MEMGGEVVRDQGFINRLTSWAIFSDSLRIHTRSFIIINSTSFHSPKCPVWTINYLVILIGTQEGMESYNSPLFPNDAV